MAYRVMVADDEPIMRKAMSSLINWEELDCELTDMAANGTEVMERLEKGKPDILIVDIKMPGKSGIEIARYIMERKLPVKVILLTAYADFSYAQSAIKYGVVDYVIKTGALESLVDAIEKAKSRIREEASHRNDGGEQILRENFFRSVFDGSLYDPEEIRETAARLGLHLDQGYLVLMIHFRMDGETDGEKSRRVHKSLLNFLSMVFGLQMLSGFAIRRDILSVALWQERPEWEEDMMDKCLQIIDMMDDFMKLQVSVGVSGRGTGAGELSKVCREAAFALDKSFFDETGKINFYEGRDEENSLFLEEIEGQQEKLFRLLKKGSKQEATAAFKELLELQRKNGDSVSQILNTGINIETRCRKILSEFDKSLYDVTPWEKGISRMIYQCRHVKDYVEIMETVIGGTVEYVNAAFNRKKALIYECEKYMEENYEKFITVADIARSLGSSPSYLSRIFKEATGHTIIQSINSKKATKAMEYLINTDMKIYEIADALGFENVTYFSHFFKKHTGISPREYRR